MMSRNGDVSEVAVVPAVRVVGCVLGRCVGIFVVVVVVVVVGGGNGRFISGSPLLSMKGSCSWLLYRVSCVQSCCCCCRGLEDGYICVRMMAVLLLLRTPNATFGFDRCTKSSSTGSVVYRFVLFTPRLLTIVVVVPLQY